MPLKIVILEKGTREEFCLKCLIRIMLFSPFSRADAKFNCWMIWGVRNISKLDGLLLLKVRGDAAKIMQYI